MPNVRRNVWTLTPEDRTLEWYGKAVGVLRSRPIADVTSWWSLAAMHGIDVPLWEHFKFLTPGAPLPPANVQALWRQCQHLTWYFLPWHRGYLAAFERIVRSVVVDLGGPNDWALPYWNYSDDRFALQLPPSFADAQLADGTVNHLYIAQRYGVAQVPNVQTPMILDPRAVNLRAALAERLFEGSASSGSAGFGGIRSAFSHGDEENSNTFGVLESQPHGGVHVLIGGGFKGQQLSTDRAEWGLMTNPDTAALDPIFWLHHANIDRLWNVWLRQRSGPGDPANAFRNPSDTDWLDGPHDREFLMPEPDGSILAFVARNVVDTTVPALDYSYDDDVAAVPASQALAQRFERLGVDAIRATQLAQGVPMTTAKPAVLLGASRTLVKLDEDVVKASVRLDRGQRTQLAHSLDVSKLEVSAASEPDRVYLKLEQVKSPTDAAVFYVYVDLPAGADPQQYPQNLAGTLSMFGVSKASASHGQTAGSGVTVSFDITPIVDSIHARSALGDDLQVQLISAVPGATSKEISIGRISLYRQAR